tara:strand:- start:4617 stop:4772 length:156 start_codon:yes stop_codon:yes gene_type:complete
MTMEDYSVFVCVDCDNEFLILDLPLDINHPKFCPFCGIDFDMVVEVEEHDM